MKMGVDETGRDETAFGFDLFIHRLGILFTDILDLIAVEHDNAVFNNFVLPAVKADDITALYESSHCLAFQVLNSNRGRTNKRNHSRQVLLEIATIGRIKPVQQQKRQVRQQKRQVRSNPPSAFAENPERSSQILPLSIEWLTIQ